MESAYFLLELILIPVLILLNGFFVAAEYAIITLRGSKIEELRRQGISAAILLARLKEDVSGSLATMQICITAVNLLIGAIAEPTVTHMIVRLGTKCAEYLPVLNKLPHGLAHSFGLFTALMLVTFFTVIISELLPKALSLQYTEKIAVWVARPVEILMIICKPMVLLMNWIANLMVRAIGMKSLSLEEQPHSEEELEMLVDQADEAGEFHEEHGELLRRAFDFADFEVRDVMIPISEAGVMDSSATVEELAAKLGERPYTRWPIRDPQTGKINGVVNVKQGLFASAISAGEAVILYDLATPPKRMPPELPLVDAIHQLRTTRHHLAVVNNSEGRDIGIVTLEDILASIVGDIPSEVKPPRIRRQRRMN